MADLIEKIQNLVAENKSLKELAKKNELENKSLKLNIKKPQNDLILRARMKKMGVNYDHFKSIFDVKDTIMAGGLITQIMTGDNWQTDIDIFTSYPTEVVRRLNLVEGWMSRPEKITNTKYAKYGTHFIIYNGMYSKHVSVDIIECRNATDAIGGFDLEFSKCYFDGKNFHADNEQAVITKTHDGYSNTSGERCTKYTMRGFHIINTSPIINNNEETIKAEYQDVMTIKAELRDDDIKVSGVCSREGCPFHK